MKFAHVSFGRRLGTMLKVDLRRLFTQPLMYILLGACIAMPVLILVMTTMMDGSVSVNPQTGMETVIEGFDNVWQIIGAVSGDAGNISMDMTGMCNINLLYFMAAVLVCVFVSGDFRCGYAKNLFTLRAKKGDYVISKMVVCSVGGGLMLLAFFVGALLGGAISGLSFMMDGFGMGSLVLCLLAKLLLMVMFVALYTLWSVIARQRLWLGLVGSMCTAMFLFMMIPLMTPLDATIVHVLLCLGGSALFGAALGAASCKVLAKVSLV